MMDQDRDDPRGIGGPVDRRESVVDTKGETQGLVVQGHPDLSLGMNASDVDVKDTGLGNALNPVRDYKTETIDSRHMELPEAEACKG